MLVLERHVHEELIFTLAQNLPAGTKFKLAVLSLRTNTVRLGIEAPRSITVDRDEVDRRKRIASGEEVDGNVAEPAEDEALED